MGFQRTLLLDPRACIAYMCCSSKQRQHCWYKANKRDVTLLFSCWLLRHDSAAKHNSSVGPPSYCTAMTRVVVVPSGDGDFTASARGGGQTLSSSRESPREQLLLYSYCRTDLSVGFFFFLLCNPTTRATKQHTSENSSSCVESSPAA